MINKITQNIWQLYFREFSSAVYLIKLNNQNILIDTGSQQAKQELLQDLKQLNLTPENINITIITHNHWDHTENNNLFPNAKIYNKENINQLPKEVSEQLKIIQTPGHSKDSIAILYNQILFSGDTLFHNGIGRTDLPESQPEKMQDSLNTLRSLNYKVLCPGHV